MLCPSCKRELPEDSKFCQFCGCSLASFSHATEETTIQEIKKPRKPVATVGIVLMLFLVFICVYWGTYKSAKEAAVNRDFIRAEKLLLLPSLTKLHDPYLSDYIIAGQLYTQGKYSEAKRAFNSVAQAGYLNSTDLEKEASYYEGLDQLKAGKVTGYITIASLAKTNFKFAVEGLESAKKLAYDQAVSLYRRGETVAAASFFRELSGYKRSADYLILINPTSYSALKKLIGFENANEILLDRYGNRFLSGTWRTSDRMLFFTISEQKDGSYQSNTNLPRRTLSHSYYRIAGGVYFLYDQDVSLTEMQNDSFERKNVFRFTIIDADTINVYCYKDDSTYKLHRL